MERQPKHELETLALLPWWTCDVACRHCVFDSSPRVKGELPLESALRVISEARECSRILRVTISGGEPLLKLDYVEAVLRCCYQQGLGARVVTNGSLGERPAELEAATERLSKIGSLEAIAVSWDGFHAEHVSARAVRASIDAWRKRHVPVRLTAVVSSTLRLQDALDALGPAAYELPVTQVRCLPVGRARKAVKPEQLPPIDVQQTGRACKSDFDTLSVTHDGSVYPCCAVGGFTPGIRLGSVHEIGIDRLLELRASSRLWQVLSARGPRALLEFATPAEVESLSLRDPEHDCVLCNRLFASDLGHVLLHRLEARLDAKVAQLLVARQVPWTIAEE